MPAKLRPRMTAATLADRRSWQDRLLNRKALAMLVRNTVVSCGVFLVGLAVLWLLVQKAGVDKVVAAGASFVVANSLHYILGRAWIFRGTNQDVARGYGFFLVNGVVGLVITVALFAALVRFTAIHYLAARVIVSLVAGLVMFLLNAMLNFREL